LSPPLTRSYCAVVADDGAGVVGDDGDGDANHHH